MELDIRTNQPGAIDTVRFTDDLSIKINGAKNSYKIVNNTGAVQLSIPVGSVGDLIAALNAVGKILG